VLIDTQLHIVDPGQFPIDVSGGGYVPNQDEYGDLRTLLKTLAENRIDRGVLVQPSCYGTDNAALFDACQQEPGCFRAVAMVEPAGLSRNFASGVRLNLTDYTAHNPATAIGIGNKVLALGMILQIQATPERLGKVLSMLPPGPVIIDHLGRPDPRAPGDIRTVADLAMRRDTWLKVSGGFRLGSAWKTPSIALRRLVQDWPPDRVIWGSDWPFLNVQGPPPRYAETLAWGAELIDLRVASRNAARLFGWQDD
jgi:predicted TIM-barrel fold metal-dependent hydrolase